jgi:O-antigen ligase
MVKAFKIAIIVFAVGFSLIKIGEFYFLDDSYKNFSAKGKVGSQRFGFLFLLAFWISAFYQTRVRSFKILKVVCILIILLGLMNTFSRSSILALLGSLIIYFYTKFNLKSKLNQHSLLLFLQYLFIFLFFGFLLEKIFPVQFNFYLYRIVYFFIDGEFYNQVINNNRGDSIGFRIIMLKEILNFVVSNPFTGSGFLGCWVMFDNLTCSSHNQYADVLFRTGVFGFCIYIYLLFRIFKYLRTTNRDLFFGFIAILIYGFAHETFKLSHGAFILSFLLAMTYNKKSNFLLYNNKI